MQQRLADAVDGVPKEQKREAQFRAVMDEMADLDQFRVAGDELKKIFLGRCSRDAYFAAAKDRGITVPEGYWGKGKAIPSDLECFDAKGMTANPHGSDWWLAVGLARLSSLARPGPPRLDIVKAVKGDRKCVLMYAPHPSPLRARPTNPSTPRLPLHP